MIKILTKLGITSTKNLPSIEIFNDERLIHFTIS